MARYIEVPANELLQRLHAIGKSVKDSGGNFGELSGHGSELAFVLQPPKGKTEVRIFTSIARGDTVARSCGEDAIRVFWGARLPGGGFKPLCAAQKVLRTAPQGPPQQRLAAFLDRFQSIVREHYRAALRAHSCPKCGSAMVARDGRRGPFLGCVQYPQCNGTSPTDVSGGSAVADSLAQDRRAHKTAQAAARFRGKIRARPKAKTPVSKLMERCCLDLPGHAVVAQYGMPHGEMARESVEDGLTAELDTSTNFYPPDGYGHEDWI